MNVLSIFLVLETKEVLVFLITFLALISIGYIVSKITSARKETTKRNDIYIKRIPMKPIHKIVFMLLSLQLAFVHSSSAQKRIKIDEQLKETSQPMSVKRKGIGVVGKYEFGPYKVITGKAGWEKVSTKSPLFGNHTSINSSSKMSFVFVNKVGDTCHANIRLVKNVETNDGTWFSRTFLKWSYSEVQIGEGVFETSFTFSGDTTLWNLAVVFPVAVEQDGYIKRDVQTRFRGILSDNNTWIDIVEVMVREDGKSPLLNPVLGYEFWQDSKALAAVQVLPGNRMYVWISEDLEPSLKFVLASSSAALLIKTF